MSGDDITTEPTTNNRHSDGIFHLCNPEARANGQGADVNVESVDISECESGDYRLTLNMDNHVYGEWDADTAGPLARLVMNADDARNLARKLTATASEVDIANGVFVGSRDDLGSFLESMDPDGPIYVVYDEVDSVYRWADLQSIQY